MSLYETYQTDPAKEREQGIEMGLPGGAKIWLKRAGGANTKFDKALDALVKPYRRQIQNGTIDPEQSAEIDARAYARAVIIDWSGVTDENDAEMACTEENIVKLFTDLPDLFREVKEQANTMSNFRREQQDADAKNSKTRSATS